MIYSGTECPYCNIKNDDKDKSVESSQCNCENDDQCNCKNDSQNNITNASYFQELKDNENPSFLGSDPIPINDDTIIEPKNYIICPNIHCLKKNSRLETYCTNCGMLLPTHDIKMENKIQDQRIVQLLDPNTRKIYLRIGIILVIAKLVGKQNNVICNNLKNDGTKCKEILTPLTKKCPSCGRMYGYYQCNNCNTYISFSAMKCYKCGSPSYLSDALRVIDGSAIGDGAERIIQDFENIFEVSLRKQAYSSLVQADKIIQGKAMISNCARQLKVILDLLCDFLLDFSSVSRSFQMQDAFSAMQYNGIKNGITEINQVNAPIPSEDLKQLLIQQQNALNKQNNDQNSQEEQNDEDDENENDDEENIWNQEEIQI